MDVKELRIGNHLQGKRVVKITVVNNAGFVRIEGNTSRFHVGNENPCLTPIPLNEEWLLKLGFEKIDSLILDSYQKQILGIGNRVLSVTIQQGNQYVFLKSFKNDDIKTECEDAVCLMNSDWAGEFQLHQIENILFDLERKKK